MNYVANSFCFPFLKTFLLWLLLIRNNLLCTQNVVFFGIFTKGRVWYGVIIIRQYSSMSFSMSVSGQGLPFCPGLLHAVANQPAESDHIVLGYQSYVLAGRHRFFLYYNYFFYSARQLCVGGD